MHALSTQFYSHRDPQQRRLRLFHVSLGLVPGQCLRPRHANFYRLIEYQEHPKQYGHILPLNHMNHIDPSYA